MTMLSKMVDPDRKCYRVKAWLVVGLPWLRLEKHRFEPDYEVYLDDLDMLGAHGAKEEVYLGRVWKTCETSGTATRWGARDGDYKTLATNEGTRERALATLFWEWEKKQKARVRRRKKAGG